MKFYFMFLFTKFYPRIRGSPSTVSFFGFVSIFRSIWISTSLLLFIFFHVDWCLSDPKDSFFGSVRPPHSYCVDNFLQVSRHFDVYQTKPEMQAEKVQLLATEKVLGKYKTRWLHWWNMSKDSHQSYNFPKWLCSIEELRPWTDIAAFWVGVISLLSISII